MAAFRCPPGPPATLFALSSRRWHAARALFALLSIIGLGLTEAQARSLDECYADIATSAEVLQICLVNQSFENECLPDEQSLTATMKVCRDDGARADRMDLARQIGAAQVQGDPAQSPYRQLLLRRQEARRLLRVNEDRFRILFHKFLNYAPQVFEQSFDSRNCVLAFEGTGQSYLMTGHSVLKRQGEDKLPQLNMTGEEQTHLFFARMQRGKCYRPDATALTPNLAVEQDQPTFIYNFSPAIIKQIPDEGRPIMIEELRKSSEEQPYQIGKPLTVKVKHYPTFLQGKVHRHLCDSLLDCLRQRAQLIDDYEAYNTALKHKNQATACLIYLDPNRTGEISIDQLYGMDCTEPNGKALLEDSGQRLQALTRRIFR